MKNSWYFVRGENGGAVMRVIFETSYNRWLVAFSSFIMFVCAAFGGFVREIAERLQIDSRYSLMPGGLMDYASLSMIALLFLTGMLANGVLILFPARKQTIPCYVVVFVITCLLVV